ncbi:MAG: hypothetical protein ACK5WF_19830 [Cyclobacteriaceae bacterium]|jgi:hypothetical protein
MKNKKIAALILFAIAAISLSFTFSSRSGNSSKTTEKANSEANAPQSGFVSESQF